LEFERDERRSMVMASQEMAPISGRVRQGEARLPPALPELFLLSLSLSLSLF
jgi:hypothetical protein